MYKKVLCLLVTMLVALGITPSLAQTNAQPKYAEGIVRVKLQREVADRLSHNSLLPTGKSAYVTTGVTPLDRANQKVRAVRMKRVFQYSPKFDARHRAAGLDLWYDIEFTADGVNATQARNIYRTIPGVEYAQRITLYQIDGNPTYRTVAEAQTASENSAAPFNDPLLADQWHYNNDGSIYNTVKGADINAFAAWESGVTGSKDVLVAIIDGGFQTDHPDLKDNVFINEAELYGREGVDDDGNGYVDDIYGYNFVINSANISAHEHGTHVAGTVGATNNNGIGVCGVAGGSDGHGGVKMLVCQVFDSRASSTMETNFAGALVYAADMGASIAQCSWGSSAPDDEDKAVTEAVKYFTANGGGEKMKGGLCIFAAGNTGTEGTYYPSCLNEVVAVGSMTATKEPAYYSTRGNWVDVTAPGGLLDYGQQYGVLSTLPNSTYGYQEGTSMACPHVSGIAALILSKYGNKDFSNETLRTLLTSSVNELSISEQTWQGKFGSGHIDAYKALQVSVGSVPSAVSDFTVTASHDNALIEWTIPDTEEKSINHHIIYYSTEPIDGSTDLTTLNSATVDTKFMLSGDAVSYELGGLQPLTTYYFVIRAYNRWGTPSTLSPVKSATTNSGPQAVIDNTFLMMDIDASVNTVGETSFSISNVAEGILKYSLSSSTRSYMPASPWSRAQNPSPGVVVPFSSKMNTMAASDAQLITSDYFAEDWPIEMSWSEDLEFYIGELDNTLPNALAQYFYVSPEKYPNGFNLTALKMGGMNGENPVIEIYDGSRTISSASLIERVEYDWFMYHSDINLSKQIFFAPGSSFWVVVKFAPGYERPLGTGFCESSSHNPQYSFYSSDEGMTWTMLKDVVKDAANMAPYADVMTWDVYAISKNPDWSAVLNPEPAEGNVRAGESQTVKLSNDGQQLVNGNYEFDIVVKTNETANPEQRVTLSMSVTGNKPQLTSAKLVDFGNILVGEEKELKVEFTNKGYGNFYSLYSYMGEISCSSDQFEIPQMMEGISARSKNSAIFKFKPTKEGNFSGVVTLTDREGNVYKFNVRGVASEPAHVSVDKSEINFGDLDVEGEEKSATIKLTNTGNYPLEYVFPRFSSNVVEGAGKTHKYGYTYISNLNGSADFAYDYRMELNGEVDITSQFTDQNWQSEPVSLGFKFPFYGEEHDKVYVTAHGSVMMLKSDGNIMCVVPTASCVSGLGYISAFANSGMLHMGPDSKVTYGRQDDKFVVKYVNVLTGGLDGGDSYTPISFRLALCPDGSIECYYDQYDPWSMFGSGANLFVGVNNIAGDDPMVVYDNDMFYAENSMLYASFMSGTAVKIIAPQETIVKSLSSTEGYIGIGESEEITVTVKAGDKHVAGAITDNLIIVTNDPTNPSVSVALKANIVGDNLKPLAQIDSAKVDFGKTFRTSDQRRTLMLTNAGRNILTVTSVSVEGGMFSVAPEIAAGFTVEAGHGKAIEVTMFTDAEGSASGNLIVKYADGTSVTIPLAGTVIGTPECTVEPDFISVETPYGEPVVTTLTVSNGGNETLTFAPVAEDWYALKDIEAADAGEVTYTFKTSADGKTEYDWQDITSDYDAHMPMSYFLDQTDFYEVTLPFNFTFYGKAYSKMYIYNTGFVSFDEPETDYKQFPEPPASLPSAETFYKNIIAPFWGFHSMDTPSEDGVYYKAYEDRVVVSFHGYGNSVMLGMNFQVILNSDGSFKFQYNLDADGLMIGVYGISGIQDSSAEHGMTIPSMYVTSGNAVSFSPALSYSVAPGMAKALDITVKADRLAGDYFESLKLQTNVPGSETMEIPAAVIITGEAAPVFPDTVGGEAVASPMGQVLEYEFEVKNNGARAFYINSVNFNSSSTDPGIIDPGIIDPGIVDPWLPDFGVLSNEVHHDAYLMVWSKQWDFLMGREVEGWTMAQYMAGPIEVGKNAVRFKVVYTDYGSIVDVDLPITFQVSGLEETEVVVPFVLSMTDAPIMTFDRPEITLFNVSTDFKGQESMTISNDGAYKLTYSLRLDPSGRDEEVENDYGIGGDIGIGDDMGIAPLARTVAADSTLAGMIEHGRCAKMQPMSFRTAETEAFTWDVPANFEHTAALYYPILQPSDKANSAIMGSGTNLSEQYYAATRYVAPEEGFHLSHLFFVGTVGNLENVDIEAEVVLGNDVTKMGANTVGRGKIRVAKEEPVEGNYFGEPRIIEFEKPMYINPADTFYVVLKYPAGFGHSAVMASKDGNMTPNRYMGYLPSMGGWFDAEDMIDGSYGYGAFGYFMTCLETTKGNPWIMLLDTATEGEVAPGESTTITFDIDASATLLESVNQATLVIKSNDPMQPIVNYHVMLYKNSAPLITLPEMTPTVAEGSETTVYVDMFDTDGDSFTAGISDESGIAQIDETATTNSFGTADGITVNADGTVTSSEGMGLRLAIKLAPDYGTAGAKTLTVDATDANGNARMATLTYNVEHVNRAPIYEGMESITVAVGAASPIYAFGTLFTDPDGDEMTFSAEPADGSVAEVFLANSGFMVMGKSAGTTTLTITATDALGLSTTHEVTVTVTGSTGIEGIESESVNVTIADGKIGIIVPTAAASVTVDVYNMSGVAMAHKTQADVMAGNTIEFTTPSMANGIYVVVIDIDGDVHAVRKTVK